MCIRDRDNSVVYATHSIFMIDRDNFDRHIVVTKKKEKTALIPSIRDRIGCFMQEEVLYSALCVNLTQDFKSVDKNNFIFEGVGDAAIFQCFLSTHNAEFNSFNLTECVFHHGGKCSDISRHFAKNPMSMGSNWVFVIDSDAPANSLATMLHGKYKKNINAEVFVCQFKTKSVKTDVELEDLFCLLYTSPSPRD